MVMDSSVIFVLKILPAQHFRFNENVEWSSLLEHRESPKKSNICSVWNPKKLCWGFNVNKAFESHTTNILLVVFLALTMLKLWRLWRSCEKKTNLCLPFQFTKSLFIVSNSKSFKILYLLIISFFFYLLFSHYFILKKTSFHVVNLFIIFIFSTSTKLQIPSNFNLRTPKPAHFIFISASQKNTTKINHFNLPNSFNSNLQNGEPAHCMFFCTRVQKKKNFLCSHYHGPFFALQVWGHIISYC